MANIRIRFENLSGYGNNLYIDNISVTGTQGSKPIADFSASLTTGCMGDTLTFTDLSQNNPTSWSWSFSHNTVSFTGGTSASSQNPQVIFNNAGNYSVTLIAANADGSDTETKSGHIVVKDGSVQMMLNDNVPVMDILNVVPVDSFYGKTHQGGLIFHIDTTHGSGMVTSPDDLN